MDDDQVTEQTWTNRANETAVSHRWFIVTGKRVSAGKVEGETPEPVQKDETTRTKSVVFTVEKGAGPYR